MLEILLSLTACIVVSIWLIHTPQNYAIVITTSLRLVVVLINLVIFCCNRRPNFQSSSFCRFFKSPHAERLFTIPVIALGFLCDLGLAENSNRPSFTYILVVIEVYQYRLPNSLLSWIILLLCSVWGIFIIA